MLKNLKEKYVPKSDSGGSPQGDTGAGDDGLVTILNRSQRADLMMLVMRITESMRTTITENSSGTTATAAAGATAPPRPQSQQLPSRTGVTGPGNRVSQARSIFENKSTTNTTTTTTNTTNTTTTTAPIARTASNTASPRATQERLGIKRRDTGDDNVKDAKAQPDALSQFGDWSDSVLVRIGNVINDDSEAARGQRTPDDDFDDETTTDDQVDDDLLTLRRVYPPVETSLARLPRAKRLLILHSLLLLMLSLKHYNAYSRVFMVRLVSSLGLYLQDLNDDESRVARGLLDAALASPNEESKGPQGKKDDTARMWKVGIASVAGAALIGVTGGLAAPLVAAGIGTVMGGLGLGATAAAGYLGALAGSGVIVGGLFGAYGGRMTGRMMDKYAREVEDFAFIPVRGRQRRFRNDKEAAQQDHRLRVTISITGWVTEEENYVVPWRVIGGDTEVFALRWELESLMNLGNAISALVSSAAWGVAGREVLSRTVFAGVMNAVMLPLGLLNISRVVDNPFSVAKARADKAGRVLADVLINKAQGERSVTLVGYSLGSRVIFTCLQTLAARNAYGLVETAILMGSPTPSDQEDWRTIRSVVTGRLVNVFSQNDSVLAFLYRTSSLQLGVAGLQPVEGLDGLVENVDVSNMISGHLRYQYLVGKILRLIRLEDVDIYELSREILALHDRDRAQEQERVRNERRAEIERRREQQQQQKAGNGGAGFGKDSKDAVDGEEEGRRLQGQVQRRTQERLMHRDVARMDLRDDGD